MNQSQAGANPFAKSNLLQKLDTCSPSTRLCDLAFFAVFYLYFALEIDVRLLYHCGGVIDNLPAFYRGWDFFRNFLTYPGGIVEYLSSLLAQSFYYSWLGAAVVTLEAWVLCLCTDYAMRPCGISRWRSLRFLAPLLLLAVYSQYAFHFQTTTALIVPLLSFCLYIRFAPERTARAILFFLGSFTVLYIVTGGPALLFAALCGLRELLLENRRLLASVQLVSAAAIPCLLGIGVYEIRLSDAYLRLLPFSWRFLSRQSGHTMLPAVCVLYLFLPLIVMLRGVARLLSPKRDKPVSSKAPKSNRTKRLRKSTRIQNPLNRILNGKNGGALAFGIRMLALACITALVILLFRNPEQKRNLRLDYYSRHGMWNEVIEIGRKNAYDYFVCHAVNRALYHTGRLGDEMFSFPQHPASLFLTSEGGDPVWQKADTCMDLGLINQAENALSISVETFGERPLLLQRLAVINMVKGNAGAARVFLGALEKVPFWGLVARDHMARLQSDPNLSQDSEIQSLRDIMLDTDTVAPADMLTLLLTKNPKNRMAYMYGMASLLLSKNLDGFALKFEMYHHLNFAEIPRHFQEALLLFRFLKKQPPDVPGQKISEQTKITFSEFSRAMQQHGGNIAAARVQLQEKFGNTYFYYYFFGD